MAMAPATPRTPHTSSLVDTSLDTLDTTTPNGTWRHPQFDEITRRQHATTFDDANVRALVANAALLAASFILTTTTRLLHYLPAPYTTYALLAARLLLTINILAALLPLARRYYPDDLSDIPLTPSQRSSMGLHVDSKTTYTPASPAYVTPPRYQRSTPRSSFSTGSPLPSNSPHASLGRSTSSSYSPGSSVNKRASSGSLFADIAPGTPSPSTGRASVGLNNKWLYEKRREGRSGMFT